MRVTVTFRHIDATTALRRHAEERVKRVAKYLHRPIDAHVILSVVKRRHIGEVVLNADRTTLKATEETSDLYSAIDAACEKLEQRARKHTSRLKSHHKRSAPRRQVESAPPPPRDTGPSGLRLDVIRADAVAGRKGPKVVRTKHLDANPMSVEEAVLQLNLVEDDFLVFHNAATESLAVVYRRKDGNYGLIGPEVP